MKKIRITGVGGQAGTLGGSVQWEYLETNADVARRVLIDLEDRRVLFYTHGREDPEFCRRSADAIRRLMTKELPSVEQGDDMDQALRAIRNAARRFINQAGPNAQNFVHDYQAFWDALERMRVAMGPHIRSMAMAYRIRLDDVLDDNLPRQDLSFIPGFH